MAERKFYWLKLQKDFFKRHDIKIIKAMPNGKDYVIFYLTLLLESLDHEGELRFSDTIPYNDEMLAIVTDTNIDIVRSAMKILTELNMVEMLDDATIYMTEVNKMLGCETKWAEKKRTYRDKTEDNVLLLSDKSKSKSKSKSIELDKELEDKKPARKKYGEYSHVLLTDEQYQKLVTDYSADKITEYIKKIDEYCQQYGKSYKDYNLTIRKWILNDNPQKPERNYEIVPDKEGKIF